MPKSLSNEELLAGLDAYGHLSYVAGYSDEWEEDSEGITTVYGGGRDRGDWLVCCDYWVWKCPEDGIIVAYHVVVNSDSGGFIDTVETGVVSANGAPYDLLDRWISLGMDEVEWTEEEIKSAELNSLKWKNDLKNSIDCLSD